MSTAKGYGENSQAMASVKSRWATLRGNRVVRGAVLYSFVGILTSGTNILLLPLLTRWMPPAEYGLLSVAVALLLLLQPIVAAGLGGGVARYFFEYSKDPARFERFFSVAFWFQLSIVSALLILVASLFWLGGVSSIVGLEPAILLPLFLAVALVPPRDIGNRLLTARQEHGRASVNQFVSFAVATCASLWMVGGLEMGAAGRLYGLASGALVAAAMMYFTPQITRNLHWIWDWEELRHALRFGLPFLPHAAALSGIAAIDRLVLRHFLDLREVGIYSAAMTLAMGMSFVSLALGRSWYPKFFQLRDAANWNMALRGQWAILCVISLIVTGFCILYPVVYPLLVAPSYLSSMKLLPIMAFASYGFGLFNIQACHVSYRKKTFWFPVISGTGFVASLLTALFLVPRLGAAGAAWATATGYLVMNIVLLLVIRHLEQGRAALLVLPVISIFLAAAGIILAGTVPGVWGWAVRLLFSAAVVLVFLVVWYCGDRILIRKLRLSETDRDTMSINY